MGFTYIGAWASITKYDEILMKIWVGGGLGPTNTVTPRDVVPLAVDHAPSSGTEALALLVLGPHTHAHTVWPRATIFGKVTQGGGREGRVSTGSSTTLIPGGEVLAFPNFWNLLHTHTRSKQLPHFARLSIEMRGKFYRVDHATSPDQNLLTRMLTRDLFAI